MYLFTANPDPYTFKPGLYVTLIGADSVLGLWAFALAILGAIVGKQLSPIKSAVSVTAAVALSIGALFLAATYLLHHL
jgi:hypothetical protein